MEDKKDIKKLYELYFHGVYLYSLKLCKNRDLAGDITQETFFKAMKNIDKFNEKCKIQVWLCTIAKNIYLDMLKKESRITTIGEIEEIDNNNIEESLIQKETAFEIHRALHVMDDPYREIFWLRVFGELSFREIGDLFQKTESWASVSFYRAKLKLLKKLRS